ncbi:MAG: Gfo/Idh/MocA family oxidoreductase [Planctomycetes bacterium]|nr:Gfo/Idh/MocA family oxidoreductase [Planctomycetota bacterium]
MNKKQNRKISRRDFMGTAAAAAALTFVPRHVLGGARYTSPSEKLNVACIGVSGMGGSDVGQVSTENLVAFADVDWKRAAGTFKRYPNVKKYRDFRTMLDKEGSKIDAVTVSTPDNIHAVAAMRAIKMRKHVYCQKPLAHDVYEVRQLTEAARKYKVMTQMGIQIHADATVKLVVEIIKSGKIGKVRKVDIFSNKNWGGGTRPQEVHPVPDTLDWDLWLGPAPMRAYHNKAYLPGQWRRWWDFGTGTLGDMGCHIIDPVFWALDLKYPISVEAHPGKFNNETYPEATVVRWEFPERGNLPPVTVTWYDGVNRPFLPKELEPGRKLPGQGGLYYGEKGTLMATHMGGPRLIPESKMRGFKVEPFLPRGVNHYQEWIKACKGGPKPSADFDYSGPLSETILLGNVAARAGKKLFWDGPNFEITNVSDGNKHLKREYREGWSL